MGKADDAPPLDVKKLAKQNEDLKNDVYDLKNQSCHHLENFIEENRKKSAEIEELFSDFDESFEFEQKEKPTKSGLKAEQQGTEKKLPYENSRINYTGARPKHGKNHVAKSQEIEKYENKLANEESQIDIIQRSYE